MTNGTFKGNTDFAFSSGYVTSQQTAIIGLNKAGQIYKTSEAHILCEKNLIDDHFACLSVTNLENALTVNQSTSLTIWNPTPQKCIEYCRGLGDTDNDNTEDNLFAIFYTSKCLCGTGPLGELYRVFLLKLYFFVPMLQTSIFVLDKNNSFVYCHNK